MKLRSILLILSVAVLAGTAGWLAARREHSTGLNPSASSSRKVLYYQSPMHPWIKSDLPGNCTICGMKLTPVYEGEKGFDTAPGVISLGNSIINVINVSTEEAQRRPLVRSLRVAGTVDDNDSKHRFVSAYIDGRIDKLAVTYVGAEVVAGEPLATFYSPTLLAAEREYITLLRQASLTNGAHARAEIEKVIAAAAERLRRLGLTDAQVQNLAQKEEFESHTAITAPTSGTVVQRFVYEGQYVKEGDKLFEIADFSTMWFKFDVYEQDLAWVRPGQMVDITTPASPGKVFSAPISFIDPNLNEMTRSAKARVELENPLIETNGRKYRELYHRLYAEGTIKLTTAPVLTIPRSAAIVPGRQAYAYVDLGNGAYEQREIKLGRSGDGYWEVLEGLEAGERVVTNGSMLIDAQAQLNQSVHGHEHKDEPTMIPGDSHPSVSATHENKKSGLGPNQKDVARQVLTASDAVAAALAGDDLEQFNAAIQPLHQLLPRLSEAFVEAKGWEPVIQAIASSKHLQTAPDLPTARKQFNQFSAAIVDFTKTLRQSESEFASLKVYKCPMTKQSFPGAPNVGFWMQMQPPLRNPYFGADMLDCGTEVKP